MTDSAGIRIASIPPLESLTTPRWRVAEIFSTEQLSIPLLEVQAALIRKDGSLLISNSASGELILLNADGEFEKTIGRQGDGPGEFRYVLWLGEHSDGSVLVYDAGNLRLTQFDRDWGIIDSWNLHSSTAFTSLLPLCVDPGLSVLGTLWDNRVFKPGETRDTVPLLLLRIAPAGQDTLGLWLGQEKVVERTPLGSARIPIGFGRNAFAAGRGGKAAIGSTDSLRVSVFLQDGTELLQIRGPRTDRVVRSADAKRWLDEALDRAPITTPEFLAVWSRAPIRQTFPAFSGLEVDQQGRIWVAEPTPPGSRTMRWHVFSDSGSSIGHVDLPRSVPHPLRDDPGVLDIADGRIALLTRNQWDEEIVVVYRYAEEG